MSDLPNVIPSSLFYSTKENLQELAIASYLKKEKGNPYLI